MHYQPPPGVREERKGEEHKEEEGMEPDREEDRGEQRGKRREMESSHHQHLQDYKFQEEIYKE